VAGRGEAEGEPSEYMMQSRLQAEQSRLQAETTESPQVDELDATDVQVAPPWMTVLHNCDCHTFEEVVKQLMKAIACSEERGWELAWQVHNTGKAVVKVGAETECVRVGNVLASIGLVVTVTQS
jgi:ATP-dependent Clp protease adapter protein ClpS